MLYYLADNKNTPMIDCLNRAIETMRHIIVPQAKMALSFMGANEEIIQAAKVWNWIDRNRQNLQEKHQGEIIVKSSDLIKNGVAGIKTAEEARSILDTLASMHYLRYEEQRNTGAKTSHIFHIRPFTPPQ